MTQYIKNPYATKHATEQEKLAAYNTDVATGVLAYYENGARESLGRVKWQDVEFIKGKWRIQKKSSIVNIDGQMVGLGARMRVKTSDSFEYYPVSSGIRWGIYGAFVSCVYNRVAVHYATDDKDYWLIADNVAQASERMSVRLYQDFQDVISAVARRKMNQRRK